MKEPKIAVVLLTYNRPGLLGRAIESFCRQTYENRELVVYDDGYQYPDQPSGDRWRVVSVKARSPNLGTKRNDAAKHASPDADFLLTSDDDDIQLPWQLAATVNALKKGIWAQPRQALEWDGKGFRRFETFNRKHPGQIAYHGNWAYRAKEFWAVGGYPTIMDDDQIAKRMFKAYGPSQDTICKEFPTPAYAYSRVPTDHLSWRYKTEGMDGAWANMAAGELPPAELKIGWDIDYTAIPIPPKAVRRAL